MQKLAEICIRRPVFAAVLILLLVVVGGVGYFQLGVDQYPNVEFPVVTITTDEPGASPEAIETEVTEKIEESVNAVSGIDSMTSYSNEGTSIIAVQFVLEKNADVAAQELRDKVNLVINQLPTDVKTPVIAKQDTDATPILGLVISGNKGIREITEYADKVIKRRIESVSGVGTIDILGGRARQINVLLDAYKMRGYGVNVTDVINALQAQNIDIPGGRMDQGDRELTLRTRGRLTQVSDFDNIIVKAQSGGNILLKDVGRTEDGVADADSVSEINGEPTVYLQVSKQSGTNTVEVINSIKDRLTALGPALKASGYDVQIVNDQSDFIIAAINAVKEHLVTGSILASIVVLVFLLNWRSTFISALAIPASIIATFGLMWAMHFTLNVLTLLALTLSVGIVIDDAIVVLENIYRFIEEKGRSPFDAAIEATREIGLAVLATTLSLVAVFLPVAFMTGIVGRFMNSFGLTMAFAIMVSLVVAYTLTPSLSARMLKAPPREPGNETGARIHTTKSGGFFGVIDRFYTKVLTWSLGHRWVIVLMCVVAMGSMKWVIGPIPKNFVPTDDQSNYEVTARAPEGTSLDRTRDIARAIAADIKNLPEVDYTVITIGGSGQNAARNNSSIYVQLKPIEQRTRSEDDMIKYTREQILPNYKSEDLRATVGPSSGVGGGVNADVVYTISGPDLDKLNTVSQKLMTDLRKVPKVVDVDTSYVVGSPELTAVVDRPLAAQLGVQPESVASALNYLVGDNEVSTFEQGGEEYEVHVRADAKFRDFENGLNLLTVPANPPSDGTNAPSTFGDTAIPLGQLVHFVHQAGPSTIQRLDRQREITIQCNILPGGSAQDALNQLGKSFTALNLGADYTGGAQGRSKEQGRAFSAFLVAFGMSMVFVYLILAAQFESWVHPITILLSLPLTVPFALLSILIFGGSLNIFSMLGILVLFGVVKKNAILQIDHTNQLRERGMARNEAIIQANRDRLRPILMTTIAFVAGMLPLIVSSGVGSGTNRAIGSVIFGGQTMSLVLTLLATPVAYSWFDDVTQWVANFHTYFGGAPKVSPLPPVHFAPEIVPQPTGEL